MSDPVELRANHDGQPAFPLIDQPEPMFDSDKAGAIGLAVEAAELTGVADLAAGAMLADVLGAGADGFDHYVPSAPALPAGFADQDFDGLG